MHILLRVLGSRENLNIRLYAEHWIKTSISLAPSAEFNMKVCQAARRTMGVTQVQPTFTLIFSSRKE